jgi:uncharacterized protein YjcR
MPTAEVDTMSDSEQTIKELQSGEREREMLQRLQMSAKHTCTLRWVDGRVRHASQTAKRASVHHAFQTVKKARVRAKKITSHC